MFCFAVVVFFVKKVRKGKTLERKKSNLCMLRRKMGGGGKKLSKN